MAAGQAVHAPPCKEYPALLSQSVLAEVLQRTRRYRDAQIATLPDSAAPMSLDLRDAPPGPGPAQRLT